MQENKYLEVRPKISDGDIVFVRNRRTFWSIVVRFFTRSSYSHVGIVFWCKIGNTPRLMLVESQALVNRRILNLSFYSDGDFDIIPAPLEWSSVADAAISRVAKEPYGFMQAAYVGLREFCMKYLNFNKLPELDIEGEICSEFVANTYNISPSRVSPQLLFEELGGNNAITIRVRHSR